MNVVSRFGLFGKEVSLRARKEAIQSTVKVSRLSLKGLQVIDGLRMKTKGEAGSIDGEKIKL